MGEGWEMGVVLFVLEKLFKILLFFRGREELRDFLKANPNCPANSDDASRVQCVTAFLERSGAAKNINNLL